MSTAGQGSDPGSFRDPTSQVFYVDGRILRGMSGRAVHGWRALEGSSFFERETAAHRLVRTWELPANDRPATIAEEWEVVLEHERMPFVSYPYEWTFSMLRDAALLQLDLLVGALQQGLTLKDATPYNVQWRGAQPVFVDIGSFEPYETGEPWIGYRQFCRQFLYPLMLRACRDVPFQPWLRGDLEGIDAGHLRNLLTRRDRLRPGVLTHVVLQARAESRHSDSSRDVRGELKAAGFRKELIEANAMRLRKVVAGLTWDASGSTWADYADDCSHVTEDRDVKAMFVEQVLSEQAPRLVWDLGANDGYFSRLAARSAETVLAIDGDELVLDRLYEGLAGSNVDNITPLVVDLANPSPGQGWLGNERRRLDDRGRPDLVLALAVLHHLVIGRNVPLASVSDWFVELGGEVVLEFAGTDDPMVRRLVANKRPDEVHRDYSESALRALVSEHYRIAREATLPSGRTILHLVPGNQLHDLPV